MKRKRPVDKTLGGMYLGVARGDSTSSNRLLFTLSAFTSYHVFSIIPGVERLHFISIIDSAATTSGTR